MYKNNIKIEGQFLTFYLFFNILLDIKQKKCYNNCVGKNDILENFKGGKKIWIIG